MLDNIRIVLINTFHPGNIGAAARAMKNMGLSQLYLVEPRIYPSEEADSRAAGAKDVLDQATVVDTLEEAISDCQLVIGTSARNRSFDLPIFDARTCGEKLYQKRLTEKSPSSSAVKPWACTITNWNSVIITSTFRPIRTTRY
ncbi:RNA methyltransferase [Aliamphritea spongicola]